MSSEIIKSDIVEHIKNCDKVKTINYSRVPTYTTATLENLTQENLLSKKPIFISPINGSSCLKAVRLYCDCAINFSCIFKIYTVNEKEIIPISKCLFEGGSGITSIIELNNRDSSWLTVRGLGHLSNQSITEYLLSETGKSIARPADAFMIGMSIESEKVDFPKESGSINLIFQIETVENNISNTCVC